MQDIYIVAITFALVIFAVGLLGYILGFRMHLDP